MSVKSVFEGAIMLELYPRSQIDLYLHVIQVSFYHLTLNTSRWCHFELHPFTSARIAQLCRCASCMQLLVRADCPLCACVLCAG
jgi:hypothetical protein